MNYLDIKKKEYLSNCTYNRELFKQKTIAQMQ